MSTQTSRSGGHRGRSADKTAWTLQHPMVANLAALAAALLAGVLIGVLFSVVLSGTGAAAQHRAGGHAVGRTAGAGSGFIEIHAGAADPAGRGFRGRAHGAGRIPAAALLRTASVD